MSLSSRGYCIKKNACDEAAIKKELTVSPFVPKGYDIGPKVIFKLYLESETKLYVPKYYGLEKFGPPIVNKMPISHRLNPAVVFIGELRQEQEEPVKKMLDACLNPAQMGGILNVFCGGGKTTMALSIAVSLGRKTLIVVHKDFLLEQWKERIEQFIPSARVGLIKAKVVDTDDKDIVLASLQSLSMKEYAPETFESFGTLVADECFPYQQPIATSKGPINIGRLYNMWKNGETLPLINSYNIDNKVFEWKKMTYAWEKQATKLLLIQFGKHKLRCTPNHKILTANGMIEAEKLKIGDLVWGHRDENKSEHACARILNNDQYQILLGSILGDGCVCKTPSGRYRLRIIHGMMQQSYCEWKANMFCENTQIIDHNGYSGKQAIRFCTKLIDLAKDIPKEKYNITQWIIDDLDPRGMAIWYMDDGSLHRKAYNVNLCTHTFDMDTHKRLVAKFKMYDIDCTISDNKGYHILRMNTINTLKFFNLIGQYIHPTMRYKIENDFTHTDYIEYHKGTSKYRSFRNINTHNLVQNETYVVRGQSYICNKCKLNDYLHLHSNDKKKTQICYAIVDHKIFDVKLLGSYMWNSKFNNVSTLKITSITDIYKWHGGSTRNTSSNVYDIEVEDNHNLVCCGKTTDQGVIVSNCHHTSAEVFSKALAKICFRYTIGLTATATRKDGLTKVFQWYLGKIVHKAEKRTDFVKFKVVEFFDEDEGYNEEPTILGSKPNVSKMLNNVCGWEPRNNVILSQVRHVLGKEPGRKLLVLSDRRNHLVALHALFTDVGFDTGIYMGGMKQTVLAECGTKQIILATYAIASEGYDQKGLDTLLLASPRSDIVQSVGRILRDKPEDRKHVPLVIDIVDMFSIFERQGKKRRDYYEKCGWINII